MHMAFQSACVYLHVCLWVIWLLFCHNANAEFWECKLKWLDQSFINWKSCRVTYIKNQIHQHWNGLVLRPDIEVKVKEVCVSSNTVLASVWPSNLLKYHLKHKLWKLLDCGRMTLHNGLFWIRQSWFREDLTNEPLDTKLLWIINCLCLVWKMVWYSDAKWILNWSALY